MVRNGVQLDETALAAFCQRHRIIRLALFGSILRDDFRPESDIDVLVEYASGAGVGFIRMAEMEAELSEMLDRRVQLHTPDDLSPYFRNDVLQEAETLYVAT